MAKKSADEPRLVMLAGTVNQASIAAVIKNLFELEFKNPETPIHLVIDTYGGSVHSMFSLYNAMQAISSPVYTIGLGKIMSAGVLLLAAGEKGHRKIGQHATVMIHPVSSINYGNIFEMEHDIEETRRLQDLLVESLSDETNLSTKRLEKIMEKEKDQFFEADEVVKMGIADIIIEKNE